jgi:hypothetical protein
MQKTKIIMQLAKSKCTRAYKYLEEYLNNNTRHFNCKIDDLEDMSFKSITGLLYSFFDENQITVSVCPENINKGKWEVTVYVGKEAIRQGDLFSRELSEFIAFQKAFQFLDTKIFLEHTKNLFYDGSADSSCINVNWSHLDKVLTYRRKNLIYG